MTLKHHGLDHIYFKAHDTLQVQAELRGLGFHTTEIDTSPSGDVTIVSAMFRSSWISVGASAQPDQAADWMSMFGFGATPVLLLRTDDNPAFMRALREMGATLPIDLMVYDRPTTTPAGSATLRFEMSTAMGGPIPPPVIVTGIRQLTPELVFRPDLTAQPNGVLDLDAFTIEVANAQATHAGLLQLFGAGAATLTDGQVNIDLGNARLILSEPTVLSARYGSLYEAGRSTLVRFRVGELSAFERRLASAGIVFDKLDRPAGVALTMASLNRCIFEFVAS